MSEEIIKKEKLKELLELHRKWLVGEEGGKQLSLPEANLEEANLVEANLEEANLEGANLEEANLVEANLEGANLWGANLLGANLERAILRGANLIGANLEEADLIEANLEGANLERANLWGADLWGANLEGAKDANLYECNWGELSDKLTLEGMRKDAASYPDPKAFARWAKGGKCPYGNLLLPRRFFFEEKKELWRKGKPKLSDWEFLRRILEEKKVKY